MGLNTKDPREQQIANNLIGSFDKAVFQQKLLGAIIVDNLPFRTAESTLLREAFEYCNPLITATKAHMARDTVRSRAVNAYEKNKAEVVQVLAMVRGKIHAVFDSWRSGNRLSLYGIVVFFLDEYNHLKLVLDIPEVFDSHTGENIAAHIYKVLKSFGIEEKMGYFTLDNAGNNDTAIVELGRRLGFDSPRHQVRCIGHIVNLAAGALLFGKDQSAFEDILGSDKANAVTKHREWQKRRPIGKLATIVVAIHRSDALTKQLLEKQRIAFSISTDPEIRAASPLGVVTYVATRWLSMLYVIRRTLKLRPFLATLWEEEQNNSWRREAKRSQRKESK